MSWVHDSSSILCWLRAEPGVDRVAAALTDGTLSFIHAINLVEVRYYMLRRGESVLRPGDERITAVGIEVVRSLDDDVLAMAVLLKTHYAPIALGDVFGVALAAQRSATFLTTDRGELEKVAAAGICRIEFLR